ncbi:hypothetical protein IFM89_025425 [Coptis chinensis]|uniref:Uncharacterized protein n=1 Tax=Coptis chinensis TaxID=261450 RepID=A0A835I444_9MAGN|nr:hypothetical protein IFM89_025425 [Coptis chinensis]
MFSVLNCSVLFYFFKASSQAAISEKNIVEDTNFESSIPKSKDYSKFERKLNRLKRPSLSVVGNALSRNRETVGKVVARSVNILASKGCKRTLRSALIGADCDKDLVI